jgi:hypothetical protein
MSRIAIPVFIAFAFVAAPALAQTAAEDEQMLETIPVEDSDDSDDAALDDQVFYSGMGVSRVETDFENLGEAVNLDLTLGFRIPTVKWFGIEIDIGQTIIPGDYQHPRPPGPSCPPPPLPPTPGCGAPGQAGATDPERDDFAMQALGLNAAFKSTGRFYGLARYGYRYLNTSNQTINSQDKSTTGFTVGGGYRWGRGLSGVEIAYKELGESVESLGLTFYVNFQGR